MKLDWQPLVLACAYAISEGVAPGNHNRTEEGISNSHNKTSFDKEDAIKHNLCALYPSHANDPYKLFEYFANEGLKRIEQMDDAEIRKILPL